MQFGQLWGPIRTAQAGSCSTVPLAGKFLLLISLLIWLSTYMQSLENPILGKLGPVKTGQGNYLKRRLSCAVSQIIYPDYYLAV